MTSEGDMNPGKVPIQEIASGAGTGKLQALIGNYNYYLQMIRDVTGLNEARDGSTPDERSLVGVQKMAAANSNTATRHILQSGMFLTSEVCECLSLRISDIIEYSPTRDAFMQAIGGHNVMTLAEMSDLHLYDFGIFLELQPDEEEKAKLEMNIQVALGQQNIELEDAIDLREIKNTKLANQLLKIRRKKKISRDQMMQQENMQAQAQANIQQQEASAGFEQQKQQTIANTAISIESAKADFATKKMFAEAEVKKQLMHLEFEMNMRLKEAENKERAKLESQKMQSSEKQTSMQVGAKQEKPFESKGNDVLGKGIDMSRFGPR
tara:strand:- start:24 stop:992 length:969 start_codon:yes stop_codon:yes gene_type:complete